ncbi:hypothetical protein M1146_06505 [Patescibacteria group bacterium]|nr:hypothetical protein [Patescibacteria group bacterium]
MVLIIYIEYVITASLVHSNSSIFFSNPVICVVGSSFAVEEVDNVSFATRLACGSDALEIVKLEALTCESDLLKIAKFEKKLALACESDALEIGKLEKRLNLACESDAVEIVLFVTRLECESDALEIGKLEKRLACENDALEILEFDLKIQKDGVLSLFGAAVEVLVLSFDD